jgi:hypothetical protein
MATTRRCNSSARVWVPLDPEAIGMDRRTIETALSAALDPALAERLLDAHAEVRQRYVRGDLEPSELNAGKFCEAAFRILESLTKAGSYTPLGQHLNSDGIVASLEAQPRASFDDAVRVHIPRTLRAVYDVRNRRGAGHLSGGVSPNRMDAAYVIAACDWVLAELVRLYHGCRPEEAQSIVDDLVNRPVPLIWEEGATVRCLNPRLEAKEQIMAMLYARNRKASSRELQDWTEYTNTTRFRSSILGRLHRERFVEWDRGQDQVSLTPLGSAYVEKNIQFEIQPQC